jgi:hypothetical protein
LRKSHLQLALLGLWIGVAGLFSFVVAPGAFSVLPTSQMAGQLISRVLSGVEIIGICVGLVFLILSLWGRKERRIPVFDLIVALLLTVSMGISHFVVSARLHDIREQMGDQLAALPSDDPVHATFDMLHKMSVGLLAFSLFSAIVLLAVMSWRDSSK